MKVISLLLFFIPRTLYFLSNRIQKINRLLKQELGRIILKDLDFPKGCLVTLTRVATTVDLGEAKVWISVFPEQKSTEIIQILNKRIYHLQRRINKILNLKRVPKIKFLIERKTKQAARIEELLGKTKEFG